MKFNVSFPFIILYSFDERILFRIELLLLAWNGYFTLLNYITFKKRVLAALLFHTTLQISLSVHNIDNPRCIWRDVCSFGWNGFYPKHATAVINFLYKAFHLITHAKAEISPTC